MHYTTLLTSALAVGTLAVPQANFWPFSGFAPLAPSTSRGPPRSIGFGPLAPPTPTAVAAPLQTSSSTRRSSSTPRLGTSTSTRLSTSRPVTLSTSVRPQATIQSPLQATAVPTPATSTIRAGASAITSAAAANSHISGPGQATLSSGAQYTAAVLYHHNKARANHNASPLTWGTDLEANARIVAENCTFAHYIPPGVSNGQNLYTTSGSNFNVTAGITESWYKSEFPYMLPYFGQADVPTNVFHNVGHLTQLLWKGTTKVGCVSYDCGNRMIVNGQLSTLNKYTVCNYSPPGNVGGRYGINVGVPISTTNLGSWTD